MKSKIISLLKMAIKVKHLNTLGIIYVFLESHEKGVLSMIIIYHEINFPTILKKLLDHY